MDGPVAIAVAVVAEHRGHVCGAEPERREDEYDPDVEELVAETLSGTTGARSRRRLRCKRRRRELGRGPRVILEPCHQDAVALDLLERGLPRRSLDDSPHLAAAAGSTFPDVSRHGRVS